MKIAIVMLWLICCLGCKAPVKLIDRSATKIRIDSSGQNEMRLKKEVELVGDLQNGKLKEVVIKHYALIPDSIRGDKVLTYLVKEEHFKEQETLAIKGVRKENVKIVSNDSLKVIKTIDKRNNVVLEEKRRSLSFVWLSLIGLGIMAVLICFRNKFRW